MTNLRDWQKEVKARDGQPKRSFGFGVQKKPSA